MGATKTVASPPVVSVIIPARNEEVCLGDCLASLAQAGVEFEVIVVDDHSADRTREIAESFPQVRVIEAGPLPEGWTGKNNAVTTGAQQAKGEWLLFTDADTVHLPGSLARALNEARENQVDLLSYSPEQIAVTFWEMAVLPVVFAELARQYPLAKVSDPNSPEAAANGQYILVKREAYDAVGGHAAIASDILEDVALARAVKSSGRKIRFRYAADAVRTRMYRNYQQLRDGWTKNLALLFPHPRRLAAFTGVVWGFLLMMLSLALATGYGNLYEAFAGLLILTFLRIRTANFSLATTFLAVIFGMPMFAYLLLRSRIAHRQGNILWKGRTYPDKSISEKGSTLATGH